MKRVKMIVTSVVVLAIVGSAFAFNAKKIAVFCVTTSTSGDPASCYTVTASKRTTDIAGVALRYYTFGAWDGTISTCTPGGANTCTTAASFIHD